MEDYVIQNVQKIIIVKSGNLEMCTSNCPKYFKDIGIGGCEKPAKTLPVGKSTLDPNYGACEKGKVYKRYVL